MKTEPDFFDPKRAGWWVWGISQWISGGWCAQPKEGCKVERKRTEMKRGVHKRSLRAPGNEFGYFRPGSPQGVNSKPGWSRAFSRHDADAVALSVRAPVGIHARGVRQQLPCISGDGGATGRGIHASGNTWTIYDWMAALAERLRRVRVCCGGWKRILGPSPTTCIGLTAVFLDPPYPEEAGRDSNLYAEESKTVAHDAARWAIEHGDDSKLRIAFCGYEGSHSFPTNWTKFVWKADGGYGSQENAKKERVWFSPHCLTVRQQLTMFAEARS